MDRKQKRRCERYLGYLLRLCMALLCCYLFVVSGIGGEKPVTAYAQESMDWSTILTYEHLGGNRIAITGITDSSVRVLKIPEMIDGYTVTKIANRAFMDNKTLVSVEIPDTVTEIGSYVFWNCPSLMNLKVPASVTVIEYGAFGWKGRVAALTVDAEKGSVAEQFAQENGIVLRSELTEFLAADTARYGMWDLTYMEFIEVYRSIGTENDLFLKMLKEKGARHTDDTTWFDYDGIPGVEIAFEDVLTEKIYALHYAPFEYNSEDYSSGNYGKDCMEAYLDHGGVCGILANVYQHFICVVLEEYNWQYRTYSNAEVNHEVLIVMTEDGRCFQADNCGVDYWWLGLEVAPDYEKIESYEPSLEAESLFYQWREEFESEEKHQWYSFCCYVNSERRPVWYNYETSDWDMYLGTETPKYYKCTYRGIDKIISMAGHTRLEGYEDIANLGFDMSVGGNRPRNVKVANGDRQVTISWDVVEGADKYTVSQYTNGVYTVLADNITDTQYTVTGLTNWESYEFLVQACVDGEWSPKKTSNHVYGMPKSQVPTEDENFYYEQFASDKIGIIGLKNTEATTLTVPEAVNGYRVVRFSTELLHASQALEYIFVPDGVSITIEKNYDASKLVTKVVTEDEELSVSCKNRGIPFAYKGTKTVFSAGVWRENLSVQWYEVIGAECYRVSVWKEDALVTTKELDSGEYSTWIYDLEWGTTYRLLVQVYIDGKWSSYTEADIQTVTTRFKDERYLYKENEDGTYTLHSIDYGYVPEGTVKIPRQLQGKQITEIGDSAFRGCEELTKIVLPDTIRKIGLFAFEECTGLECIILSPNVTAIEFATFWDCSSLKKIFLPDSVTEINRNAFDDDIVIYAPEGSAAATFAKEKGLEYVAFDGTPQNVLVTEEDQALSISWDVVEFADSYAVTVLDTDGVVVVQESSITDTVYVADGLQNGKEYRICVQSEIGSIVSKIKEEEIVSASPYSISELKAFVSRFYELILGRDADSGLDYWVTELLSGTKTGAEVAAGFVLSEEFLGKEMTNAEYIRIMYQTFFGREADEGGLAWWLDAMENGTSKQEAFAGFVNSDEFEDVCAEYGITRGTVTLPEEQEPEEPTVSQFVKRLYSEIMGRDADDDGLNYWVGELEGQNQTGAEAAAGFIMSEEFQGKEMTNAEYIGIMYRTFFGRSADEDGLAWWLNAMENGYSKWKVFAGFANSDEFGTLCDTYGIIQGSITEPSEEPEEEEPTVRGFIKRLYSEIMGRDADEGGLSYWVGELEGQKQTGAEAAAGFILSEEFQAREMTNAEYIRIMYRTFFGRDADEGGLAYWIGEMENGTSKFIAFAGFANSDEFGELCEMYGITQGEVTAE